MAWIVVKGMESSLLVKAYTFTLSNDGQGDVESCIENRLVVVSTVKEWKLKIGESHCDMLGKDGSNGEDNNDGVDNRILDKYKNDRQQLMWSPKLFLKMCAEVSAMKEWYSVSFS